MPKNFLHLLDTIRRFGAGGHPEGDTKDVKAQGGHAAGDFYRPGGGDHSEKILPDGGAGGLCHAVRRRHGADHGPAGGHHRPGPGDRRGRGLKKGNAAEAGQQTAGAGRDRAQRDRGRAGREGLYPGDPGGVRGNHRPGGGADHLRGRRHRRGGHPEPGAAGEIRRYGAQAGADGGGISWKTDGKLAKRLTLQENRATMGFNRIDVRIEVRDSSVPGNHGWAAVFRKRGNRRRISGPPMAVSWDDAEYAAYCHVCGALSRGK